MKVAIYSRTPMAGAPWELFKALRKYTLLQTALVTEVTRYADGRIFPHHLLLSLDNGKALSVLNSADVWHVNNYLTGPLASMRRTQKVLAQFHSLPRLGNWSALMSFANLNYTIQQPLQEKEYRLPGLPNIIDPDEYRPVWRKGKTKIAFAPTNQLPIGNPASKGYHAVRAALNKVASERDVEILWIEGRDYEENLRLKATADILVDDVVTGNFHRTSLEGACFGCAVLNNISKVPFVHANLKTLKEKLLWLIDKPANLRDIQARTRLWALQEWHAMDLVKKYVRAYRRVLNAH